MDHELIHVGEICLPNPGLSRCYVCPLVEADACSSRCCSCGFVGIVANYSETTVAVGAVWYGRRLKDLSKQFQDRLAEASSTAEENLSLNESLWWNLNVLGSMRTVRSFHNEEKVYSLYKGDIDRSYDVGSKLALVTGGFNGLVSLVAQLAILLVLFVR